LCHNHAGNSVIFYFSSEKFLDGLLDMWTNYVVRQQGALVVSAMLDFLTFSLCSPYSETTDSKQFDMLLGTVLSYFLSILSEII
jgi:DnaJ family protein C protein 13